MTHTDPITESIRPFRRRLALFAALRALLAALAAGGFVFALLTLGYKIARRQSPADGGVRLIWLVTVGAALVTMIAAFLVLRPNQRETARQIDALGLKDRTVSMLALRDSGLEIAGLQREDALRHLCAVRASDLRGRIGILPVVLVLLALLAAAASVLVPVSRFAPEQNEAVTSWDDVVDLLREQRDRLAGTGEDRLADVFDELITEMEGTDNVLQVVGKISDAEKRIGNIADQNGASPDAKNEALDTLGQARQMLLGKERTDGEEKKGVKEKEAAGMPAAPEESEQDAEGEAKSLVEGTGNKPQSSDRDGKGQSLPEGDGAEQAADLSEPVYDPISGFVPYGKVFSVYWNDYLHDAENGSIPYEVSEAARSYFENLDKLQNP